MPDRLSGTYVTVNLPRETGVGVVILLVLALAIGGGAVLVLGGGDTVEGHALFRNAAGLTGGDPVLVSGARVGKVTAVDLASVDRVVVSFSVAAHARPRRDAAASIQTLNLVGDRFLDLRPGRSAEFLPDSTAIVADSAGVLVVYLARLREDATRLAQLTGTLRSEELRRTLADLDQAIRGLEDAAAGVPDSAALAALDRLRASADSVRLRLDALTGASTLDSARARLATMRESLAAVSAAASDASAALGRIQGRIRDGDGTLGRLLHDTVFAADLRYIRNALPKRR